MKHWLTSEEDYLINNLDKLSTQVIADRLGRTDNAVRMRLTRLRERNLINGRKRRIDLV